MGKRYRRRLPPQTSRAVALFLFHHPFPSATCPGVQESDSHPSLLLPSTGSPAGRCACQCGHPECPGLLQAVEGDWLRLIPKPCSGADSRSLLPSLAAGTTTCSHPTTDSRTHSGRKPSCTQAEGGPRSQLGGWAPPVAKTTSGSEESIWSRRGLWAPSQPSCLNPPAVPRGGWQAWV